jgi:two-component system invasion response regulator UvrY
MTIPEKISILIADKHAIIRQSWKLLLEQDVRFQVVSECTNSSELMQLLSDDFPEIILMDINLTPLNGFDATRKIIEQWPHARIIGLSINDQAVYAKNLLLLGAKGYVTKDSSKSEMIEAIMEVMNGREYICKDVRNKVQKNFIFRKD